MAVGEQTVGTKTSAYPGALKVFPAQTESLDPVTEDPDFGEGGDANDWSANQQALMAVVGLGSQGVVEVTVGAPPLADIGEIRFTTDGVSITVAEVLGFVLTGGVINFIYVDVDASPPVFAAAVGGFPAPGTVRFIPLAVWDDLASTLADFRPQRQAPIAAAAPGSLAVVAAGGNGGQIKQAVGEFLATGSGATLTATGIFPAGCIPLGVCTHVVTADGGGGGATGMDIGDGTDADAFGAAAALTLAATTDLADHTVSPLGLLTAAGDVVLTALGGTFDAASVRIQASYIQLVAPTS